MDKVIDNKFRIENTARIKGWKYTFGLGSEISKFTNSTFNKIFIQNLGEQTIDFDAKLIFAKYSAFGQVSRSIFNNRLDVSIGIRIDGSSYNANMSNPFKQFSPRLSLNLGITEPEDSNTLPNLTIANLDC